MGQGEPQPDLRRFSLLEPMPLTIVVYGGLAMLYLFGDLNGPVGRLLMIPGLFALVMVPIFTMRAIGQAAGASLAGSRILWFTTGPFMLRREDDALRPGLNRSWRRYTGRALVVPRESSNIRSWVAARGAGAVAGIVAYVILVLALSPLIQSMPGVAGHPDRVRFVATSLFGLSVLTATVGIWNLVNTHGPRIWRMLRHNSSSDRQAALIALTALGMGGVRPRDWPDEWVEMAAWDDDASLEGVYGQRFGYLQALDRADFERAGRYFAHMRAHGDRMRGRMRKQVVDVEVPFVEAWVNGDTEAARESLDALDRSMVERHRLYRIEAAVLYAEGADQAARQAAVHGLNAIQGKLDDGEAQWEADVMDQILARTEAAIGEEETVPSAP
jgi:hypothetical protein